MPRTRIRVTTDEYRVLLKLNKKWEQVAVYNNMSDAIAYIDQRNSLYRSEFLKETLKVVKKRVPNPDAQVVYYVMYRSGKGKSHVMGTSFSVTNAEDTLAWYRERLPKQADKFYVRKSVEVK